MCLCHGFNSFISNSLPNFINSMWHCWPEICAIKKIMWYLILLKSSISLEYSSLVQSSTFFFFFLLFVFVGMAWIVKLSGLTIANTPLNGLHAHVRKMHDIQEVSCVKKCKRQWWHHVGLRVFLGIAWLGKKNYI